MLEAISELFYKSKGICYFCKENIEDKSSNEYLCCRCEELIKFENKEILVDSDIKYIDRLIYSLSYNRFLREKIKEYKYYEHGYLYKVFGEYMFQTIKKFNLEDEIEYIMFVPSSREKHVKKLYNQSELLADYLSIKLNKPIKYNLKKIKDTKEQNKLDARDRLCNLDNAFILINEMELRGRCILLVDDIVTTGSTLSTCSNKIKQAGASNIIAIALTSTNSSGKI